jgi:hypothetical protein
MNTQTRPRHGRVAVLAVVVVVVRGAAFVMQWPSVIDTCAKSASVTAG